MKPPTVEQRLATIEGMLKAVSNRDAELNTLREEYEETLKRRDKSDEYWGKYRESVVEACLEAWRLLEEAQRIIGYSSEEKGVQQWHRDKTEFLLHCRNHVWSREEDPFYDPNEDCDCH